MKTNLKYCILILYGVMISCTEINDQKNIAPQNQHLPFASFKSLIEFDITTNRLSTMSISELDSWERNNSFKSYRSVLNEAQKEWSELDNPEKQDAFLLKYNDILSLRDGSIVPSISVFAYQAIVNREGIYKTGNHFPKVIGSHIVSVAEENIDGLRNLKIVNGIPLEEEGKRVFKYTGEIKSEINSRTQLNCGPGTPYKEASYFYDQSGCANDRQAFISALTYVTIFTGYGDFNGNQRYGDYYQSAVQVEVWGKIRQRITCNWADYSTQLEWQNVSYSVFGPRTIGYDTNQSLYTYQFFNITLPNNDSVSDIPLLKGIFKYGDVQFNAPIAVGYYGYLHAEGKSRGIGNNWAIINCP